MMFLACLMSEEWLYLPTALWNKSIRWKISFIFYHFFTIKLLYYFIFLKLNFSTISKGWFFFPSSNSIRLLKQLSTWAKTVLFSFPSFLPRYHFKNICVHTDPLKMTENAVVHIPGLWVALDIHQKRRRRYGACTQRLRSKQTDSRRRNWAQQEEDENGYCKETRIVCVDRYWGRTAAATHTQLQGM